MISALRPGRRIPVVEQMTETECSAACLAMVLGYLGRPSRVDDVRQALETGRGGASALAILHAARGYGLAAEAGTIELDDLARLPPATILHWNFNHFVVFDRADGDRFRIVDPASGRRAVSRDEMSRSFTGVVLLFAPTESFESCPPPPSLLGRYVARLARYRAHWGRILVTSVFVQCFALAVPILMGALVDHVLPARDTPLLGVLAAGLGALVVFEFAASLVRGYMLLDLRTKLDAEMTRSFLEHVVDLPLAFFQRRSAGDLIMRLNSNATLREVLTSGALSTVLDGALVLLYLAIFVVLSPAMTAAVVATGALHALVYFATRAARRERQAETLHAQARADSYQVELFGAIETLKAMGAERRALTRWTQLYTSSLNATFRSGAVVAVTDALNGALRLGGPLFVLGVGAWLVLRGRLSLGVMLSLDALAAGLLAPVANMVETARQIELAFGFVARLDDVLQSPVEQAGEIVQPAHRLRGAITCDRLLFRYDAASPPAVDGVTLSVREGELVAIVGRSGSGKSTLASLLLGLHAPSSGDVRYDGAPLASLDVRTVRRQVGVVTQSPAILSGSIRSNLTLAAPDASFDDVARAASIAQLHDDVVAMPMGYDTAVGDGGCALSGGQRQRLALARALLARPAILVLDEATSALDAVTEAAVQSALDALRCTRIVVAHRLSTVARADRILVMRDGRVVESGRHAELLARGGEYAKLAMSQIDRGISGRAVAS
jgi:ABC-type bacteriocin/lantibiotic exporter with double-glycine peptidase domain